MTLCVGAPCNSQPLSHGEWGIIAALSTNFLPSQTVTFAVECSDTLPGDKLFVIGSCAALGSWTLIDALPLSTNENISSVADECSDGRRRWHAFRV
jgi:hypothetical protein